MLHNECGRDYLKNIVTNINAYVYFGVLFVMCPEYIIAIFWSIGHGVQQVTDELLKWSSTLQDCCCLYVGGPL